jgi:hypothetical protein
VAARHQVTCILLHGSDKDRRIDAIGGPAGGQGGGAWRLDFDRAIAGNSGQSDTFSGPKKE